MKTVHKIKVERNICDFCGVCVGICPSQALILKEREINIISELCKQCYWCIDVCPIGALQIDGSMENCIPKEK